MRPRHIAIGIGVVAVSLLIIEPAPGYDGWTWLLWGREVAGGELDTRGGPAFKPLPVALCALVAPLGDLAPWAWAAVVRGAALVALWLAFRLGRELAGGSLAGGALAALCVAFCGQFLALAASGAETAPLLALALGGAAAWRSGRAGLALACGVGCALLRVETWPFLGVAAVVAWRARPALRPALAGAAVAVPALWFVPELVGSGDPLRSGERARVPNPGAPAEADVPFLASLLDAVALPLWPVWLGVAALAVERRRRGGAAVSAGLAVAAAGAAWILLVAAMAQAGFSGEARYALPGAILVSVAGAAGLARALRDLRARGGARAAVLAAVLFAAAVVPRVDELAAIRGAQAYQWQLYEQLGEAVAAVGGPDRVLACGRPFTGALRGPLLAYRLDVPRSRIEPDAPPRAPGAIFRSALLEGQPPAPGVPSGFQRVATTPRWAAFTDCRS